MAGPVEMHVQDGIVMLQLEAPARTHMTSASCTLPSGIMPQRQAHYQLTLSFCVPGHTRHREQHQVRPTATQERGIEQRAIGEEPEIPAWIPGTLRPVSCSWTPTCTCMPTGCCSWQSSMDLQL